MKCPIDHTEMEVGKIDRGMWIKGEVGGLWKILIGRPMGVNSSWIRAWRCPNCGKIELATVPDNKEDK